MKQLGLQEDIDAVVAVFVNTVVSGAAFPAAATRMSRVVVVARPFANGHRSVVYFVCGRHARAIARWDEPQSWSRQLLRFSDTIGNGEGFCGTLRDKIKRSDYCSNLKSFLFVRLPTFWADRKFRPNLVCPFSEWLEFSLVNEVIKQPPEFSLKEIPMKCLLSCVKLHFTFNNCASL